MDAIDVFTTACDSYGDWKNVGVAIGLNVGLIVWALLGMPGRPQG